MTPFTLKALGNENSDFGLNIRNRNERDVSTYLFIKHYEIM